MKRALVISLLATIMAVAFSLSAFAFLSFGYLHGVPNNDGEIFLGLDIGDVATNGEFNVQAYLGDLWVTDPIDPGVFLGLRIFYELDIAGIDLETGGYLGSNPLAQWPAVGTGEAGLYLFSVFHLFPTPCVEPEPCGNIAVDLIVNLELEIDPQNGMWAFGGEIGFEVGI